MSGMNECMEEVVVGGKFLRVCFSVGRSLYYELCSLRVIQTRAGQRRYRICHVRQQKATWVMWEWARSDRRGSRQEELGGIDNTQNIRIKKKKKNQNIRIECLTTVGLSERPSTMNRGWASDYGCATRCSSLVEESSSARTAAVVSSPSLTTSARRPYPLRLPTRLPLSAGADPCFVDVHAAFSHARMH